MKCVNESFQINQCAILLVDLQEKLFRKIYQHEQLLDSLINFLKIIYFLKIPLVASEQYPEGLGSTIQEITNSYKIETIFKKTTFSAASDPSMKDFFLNSSISQWIIVGIETHICIFQTAKDLLALGKKVIVLEDCVGARNLTLHQKGVQEMHFHQIRLSIREILLYEMIKDAATENFKNVLPLIKKL